MNENTVSLRKMRWMLFLLGKFRIPMIGFLRPKLIRLDDGSAKIKIRLRRHSRNHLGSMYFGALAVGADIAGGILAFYFAKKMGKKVSFAFKSVSAEFLKRAETHVVFECAEGLVIERIVRESCQKQERINQVVRVEARNSANEIVALFDLEISVRVK